MNEPAAEFVPYEQRLSANTEWALMEGSRHFGEANAVFDTLDRIAKRLEEIDVAYAVVGGLALFFHGYRRFTEDVDLLVTPEGLEKVHKELDGLGYLPPFEGSKHLRDTQTGVKVEFLTTGDYPGDGKPKAVSFPNPQPVDVDEDGRRYLPLDRLVELKLASGISAKGRRKDLADVQELIVVLSLEAGFAEQLDPSVREAFLEIWHETRG